MYIIDRDKTRPNRFRSNDFHELSKMVNHPSEDVRKAAYKAVDELKKEASNVKIGSMRESLIKAHREGNHAEIRDINEYVASHDKYKNE